MFSQTIYAFLIPNPNHESPTTEHTEHWITGAMLEDYLLISINFTPNKILPRDDTHHIQVFSSTVEISEESWHVLVKKWLICLHCFVDLYA